MWVFRDGRMDLRSGVREIGKEVVSHYHLGPVYTPPTVSKLEGPLGPLTMGTASGGTNWPGGSYDPETHTVYVYACNACVTPIGLVRPPKELSDIDFVHGTAGREARMVSGPGENAGADAPMPSRAPAPARPAAG